MDDSLLAVGRFITRSIHYSYFTIGYAGIENDGKKGVVNNNDESLISYFEHILDNKFANILF